MKQVRLRKQAPERTWNLQDAKARLSELVDRCLIGEPQIILRRGQPAVVVLPYAEYEQANRPRETLLSFFQRAPSVDLDYDAFHSTETTDQMREIDL